MGTGGKWHGQGSLGIKSLASASSDRGVLLVLSGLSGFSINHILGCLSQDIESKSLFFRGFGLCLSFTWKDLGRLGSHPGSDGDVLETPRNSYVLKIFGKRVKKKRKCDEAAIFLTIHDINGYNVEAISAAVCLCGTDCHTTINTNSVTCHVSSRRI